MTIGPIWARRRWTITPKHVGIASRPGECGLRGSGYLRRSYFGPSWCDQHGELDVAGLAGSVGLLAIGIVMTFFMRPDIALDKGADNDDETRHELKLADRLGSLSNRSATPDHIDHELSRRPDAAILSKNQPVRCEPSTQWRWQ